jgi:hypothetical protein
LTNKIDSSTGTFHYYHNPTKANTVENIFAKKGRPRDLPKLLIRTFLQKINHANQEDLQRFLGSFKRKFFKTNEKRYTRSIDDLTWGSMLWYTPEKFESLKSLFKTGINPSLNVTAGLTPILHHAIAKAFPPTAIEWLLNNGAPCSGKNSDGELPLFTFLKKIDCYDSKSAIEILSLFDQNGALFTFDSEGFSSLEYSYRLLDIPRWQNSLPILAVIEDAFKRFGWQGCLHQHQPLGLPYQPDALIKRLQNTDFPSGYTCLKKRIEFDKILIEEGFQTGEISLFRDTDVEIVSDKHENALQLHQMTLSEASACQALFEKIKNGKTCIQWQNDKQFGEQVLECIVKLLTRPSGRALIYLLVKSNYPLFIIENRRNNGCMIERMQLPGLISVDFSQSRRIYCLNSVGVLEEREGKFHLRLCHELLHALLNAMDAKTADELSNITTKNKQWSNLNEQFVIAGLEGENLLCENMLRFEFGELARWGHESPQDNDVKSQ